MTTPHPVPLVKNYRSCLMLPTEQVGRMVTHYQYVDDGKWIRVRENTRPVTSYILIYEDDMGLYAYPLTDFPNLPVFCFETEFGFEWDAANGWRHNKGPKPTPLPPIQTKRSNHEFLSYLYA